jgi:hypothetical protein
MVLPQLLFVCGFLYSVLVTVSESRYFSGSATTSFSASASDSALTAQDLVILKYFRCHSPHFPGYVPAVGCQSETDNQWAETPLAFAHLLHALISLLRIRWINFDPYIPPAKLLGCHSGRPGAHKGVKDNVAHAREGHD